MIQIWHLSPLRLVGNFYELYILNLKQWISGNDAEDPWKLVFNSPGYTEPHIPWDARSMDILLLSMYAYIRSDLPMTINKSSSTKKREVA